MIMHLITLSLLILIIMLLRVSFRHSVSPTVIYAMWLLVAVKLFLPVSFFTVDLPARPATPDLESVETWEQIPSPVTPDSIYTPKDSVPSPAIPLITEPSADFIDTVPSEIPPIAEDTEPMENDSIKPIIPDDTEAPDAVVPPIKTARPINWNGVICAIWLIGSAAVAVYFFASWTSFTLKVRRDRKLIDTSLMKKLHGTKVYVSENVGGSCLLGLIPSIYLTPEVAESEDASLVIDHEYTHLIHGDCLWSAVRIASLILFWWNPLVWAAAILSKQDAELACDHSVISKLDSETTLRYARIIVDAIPRKRLTVGLGSGQIKERILMITKKRKTTVIAAIFAVILALLFTGCSFIGIGRDEVPDFYDKTVYDVGLYLQPNPRDHMIIVGGTTPCIVTGDVSFADLSDGDIVSFRSSEYLDEIYPMRAEIYSISKLADGEASHIDENILNELAEKGFINSFTLPDSFHVIYEKAEMVYSLFTGYADSNDIAFYEQLMNRENVYVRAIIDNKINTLAGLRELCAEIFSEEITDYLMSKSVQPEYPVFTELDGNLFRFGGYASQYCPEYDPVFIPLILNNGVYSVKVQASCIFDGKPIHGEAIVKYTVDEDGEIHFTDFTFMKEIIFDIYIDYANQPKDEPITDVRPDLEATAPGEPFWACIAIYGDPGGYFYNGHIVAPEDGVRYFVFGRPENRWATEIAEYDTFKVVTENGSITLCARFQNNILLFPAPSSYAYTDTIPDGHYETQARYDGASDGNRMVYRINIDGSNINISAVVVGTDLGGEYTGTFTHDRNTGEVVLDLTLTRHNNGEVMTSTHTVRGMLQKVDNLIAFTCTDPDGATFTEGSPLIFVTSEFAPDDFAERFNKSPEKFLFYHSVFPQIAGTHLYFCSRSDENRVNSDFSVYYSMGFGETSGKLDVKLPDDLEYDTVLPIAATGGGGSGECVFYLKLTKGTEVFYAAFDNTSWGEESVVDSFEYKGIIPTEEMLNILDTLPSSYGSKYVEEIELYYTDDPRGFTLPGMTKPLSISPWGDDKMFHFLDTEEDNPVIYYSRKVDDGLYGVIKTELASMTSVYSKGTVIDILYMDDFHVLLTVRCVGEDGETYDVQYRGYAHEIAVNAIETGKKEVSFVWDHINTEKANKNNLARGQFSPIDYYDQIPDPNAEVLFHLKTNGYCYYFCTVGNDFAVYYHSYYAPIWQKFEAEVPAECKYDTAVPIYARVNNEYGNGCQFWLELTNKGHKYYLRFADVYAIGIVANRFDVTEQMQQYYPGIFEAPTEMSITSLDDWEEFNYDGVYKEKCYELLHMLLSGESGIPEFDGLGISEYKLTRMADMELYAPTLHLEFTVTGNSMPESLPAGKYSKIIDLTYDIYLLDTEPAEPLENSEALSYHELKTFFAATQMWDIPDHNTWDTSEVLIPASYLAFKYSQEGKVLDLANFKKMLYIQFAIEDIRDLSEGYSEMNVYLDKAVYNPTTDSFHYWDTRGSQCAYKVTDITMDGEIAYITVQLFADEYNLLPSHLVRYKMDGAVFVSCEVLKESHNQPYGFRGIELNRSVSNT